ncbi:putative F-box/kelch-repeat protein [Salvia divinorum]|uniref:F-box/kelch-repeat protein n=1 Tax=Salvia divinorum TaxID=28513 RepID=A0ABD1HJF1_SALDI
MDPVTLQFPILLAASSADAADELPETAAELKDDILEEILSWLPAKSVLRWKSVSKPWQRMLDKPVFSRIHFSRASACPLLVSGGRSVCRSCRILHLVEGRSVSDLDSGAWSSRLISRFDIRTRAGAAEPSKVQDVFLRPNTNATSCEGLLCWTAYDQNRGDCIVVCNPITAEYVSLSSSPMDEDDIYAFVGMGYSAAKKRFELLRMAARADDEEEDMFFWPEIRSVGGGGDGSWRRVGGGTSQYVLCRTIAQVVYVSGGVYWSYDGYSVVCCYDFDNALFQIAALPKMSLSMLETNSIASKSMSLGVLDAALCASLVCPGDGHVELFVLETATAGLQWRKLYDVETKTTFLEHAGILWPRGQYKAIKYLSRGEILMHDWRGKFLIYNPVTKEERHVCVLEDSRLEEDLRNDGVDDLQVVSHVPRLGRLREALNVGEEEVQVMKGLNLYDEEEQRSLEEDE